MIKANELRIGNCLKYTTHHYLKEERRGNIFRVIPDDIVFLSDTGNVPYVEPIPITPEILEKCGFMIDENYELKTVADRYFLKITISGNNENILHATHYRIKNETYCSYTVEGYWAAINLKYVHELQNLYFAMTGEELEVKL